MLNRLIGREAEYKLLTEKFELACDGHSQFLFINGEAGWGKSILIDNFCDQYKDKAVIAIGRCLIAREESEPYFPFLDLLTSLSEAYADEAAADTQEKVASYGKVFAKAILENGSDLIGTLIPAYSNVINTIKKVEKYVGKVNEDLEKAQQKNKNIANGIDTSQLQFQYSKVLESVSEKYPLILIIDSLQWADISSIDLLFYLTQKLKKSRILFIYSLNYRELLSLESDSCQLLKRTINELRLEDSYHWIDMKLSDPDARFRLLKSILLSETNSYTDDFIQTMFKNTDGNPLFTFELMQQLKERGDVYAEKGIWKNKTKVAWDMLPRNVEGIIEAKISKLSAELKTLLTISSVEGYSFSGPLVARMEGLNDRDLVSLIVDKLIKTYGLVVEDQPQQSKKMGVVRRYRFISKIYQQYIYRNIPATERMILHGRIAETLEELSGELGMSMDYQLAHHYCKAKNEQKAAQYFHSAAKSAMRVGAYKTAIDSLKKTIASLPEKPPKTLVNFACQARVDLAIAIKIVKGWGDKHTHEAYKDCIQFAEKNSCQNLILPVVYGIWGYHIFKNDIKRAYSTSQRLLQLSTNSRDKVSYAKGTIAMANSCYWNGRIEESQQFLHDFYNDFEFSMQEEAIEKFGNNPLVSAYMFSALNYTHMGDFTSALGYLDRTLSLVNTCHDKFSEAIALTTLSWVYCLMEDNELSQKYAEQLENLAKDYDISLYLIYAYLFKGSSQFRLGMPDKAALSFKQSEEMSEQMEQGIMGSVRTLMEFELLLEQSRYQEILRRSNHWTQQCEECGEYAYIMEFYRYKGVASFLLGEHSSAMEAFEKAINISKQQGAIFFERRGTESYLEMLIRIDENPELQEQLKAKLENELRIKQSITKSISEGADTSLMELL